MVVHVLRLAGMLAALGCGYVWLAPRTPAPGGIRVRFEERAEANGCRNRHTMVRLADVFDNIMPWLSSVGAAAAAGDFDNDGYADLYVTNSGRGQTNRLFRNKGDGAFEDVAERAGVGCGNPQGGSMHAVWGDVDNDGDLDLYVVKWAEPNQLFRNDAGAFTDISSAAQVDYWGYGNGATFFDFDRDGRLDLLVGNYFAETVVDPRSGDRVRNNLWNPVTTRVMHETFTHADNGGRNVLYRNITESGVIRFEDATLAVGMSFTGWTLSVGSGDLNNDGWPDVYVANDFGPDELYLNTGATENPPRMRLVVDPRGHPGVGNDWWKGMNVDMADVNNDGYLDIYVTNILEKSYKTDEGNMLWLNVADPAFPGGRGFWNIGEESKACDGGWGWGGKFADFNNDGLMDIYTVNGFVTGDLDRNYWFAIQEMVTQTKNQTADAADWPVMGTRDLSGRERGRLFVQLPEPRASARAMLLWEEASADASTSNEAFPTVDRHGRSSSEPRFAELAAESGIDDVYNGRGIALADFDHDGYVDMYVANQGTPSCYYVNRTGRIAGSIEKENGSTAGFIRLKLIGRPDLPVTVGARTLASSADAVGARVTVFAGDLQQVREVQGGMGFAAQSEHAVHFGLPNPAAVTRIEIRWPSGRVTVIEGNEARHLINRHTTIMEVDENATM